MLLAKAPLSKTVRVVNVRQSGALSGRLMEMGLVEGATVQVLRRAPLGDPLHVRLGGDYELSIRGSEAELIEITAVA